MLHSGNTLFQYISRKVIEDKRSELESLISTKQGSQMEADWQALISTSEDWAQQLDLAEARVVHLDTTLTDLDLQVCKVEREQAGWALPHSLDTAETEVEELEQEIEDLRGLEESVVKTKLLEAEARGTSVTAHKKLEAIERWLSSLQEVARRRREQMAGLQVQKDPGNQEWLGYCVPEGWEQCLTEDLVLYSSLAGSVQVPLISFFQVDHKIIIIFF